MPHKRASAAKYEISELMTGAKKSVRDAETKKKGYNLAPSASSYDDAPRGAMRILNSLSTQQAFRAKGGRTSEDTGERRRGKAKPDGQQQQQESGAGSSSSKHKAGESSTSKENGKGKAKEGSAVPKIMPHESLGDYNRRVESILRSGVSAAIKSANAKKTEQLREAQRAKEERKRKAAASTDDEEAEQKSRGKKGKHDVSDPALEFASAPTTRRLNDIAQAPPSLPTLKAARSKHDSVWAAKGAGKSGLSAAQERILADERERVIKRYRELKAGKEAEREASRK